MSRVNCRTRGCPHYTLQGYRKHYNPLCRAIDGTEPADGVFCWRCRRKHRTPEEIRRAREEQRR